MRAYIKKLQKKEEHVRKQILVLSLGVSMAVVVFIWIYGLGDRFNNKEIAVNLEKDTKPFVLFKNSVTSAYQNISASVGNIPSFSKLMNKDEEIPGKQIDLILVEVE